ncbi:hypothetical protein JCM14469_15400 [Desulfatiferula olefinivorans]
MSHSFTCLFTFTSTMVVPGCDKSCFVLFLFFRERSDRVVEWIDHEAHEGHEGKEPRLFSVMAWDAHRSVAVRHAPACPGLRISV